MSIQVSDASGWVSDGHPVGDAWIEAAAQAGASDLHVTPNGFLMQRVDGSLVRLGQSALTAQTVASFARQLVGARGWQLLEESGQVDVPYALKTGPRCRVHAYRTRMGVSVAVRLVPADAPDFESLGLPRKVLDFAREEHGLVLITGPTGSGKSTTLAALVGFINHNYAKHIVTLEDPIEFIFESDLSLVEQRQVGTDTHNFQHGLRSALRQAPDVIVLGEMRDLETIATAVTAAETGQLVLATLHAPDAAEAVHRIIDVFEPRQQAQVRTQLASVLRGVVAQRLIPRAREPGRVPLCEVLVNTPAVANLIRSDKVHQLETAMQTGRQFGMQTMDMHRQKLLQSGVIPT